MLPILLEISLGPVRLTNLPHDLSLQAEGRSDPASKLSRSFDKAVLCLISLIGTPRSIAARITEKSFATVNATSRPNALTMSAGLTVFAIALIKAIENHADDTAEFLRLEKVQLPSRAVNSGDR